MKREPLVTVASVTAAATALVGVLVAFGVTLSDDQRAAVLALVGVVAPFVVAVVGRRKVTPVPVDEPLDGRGTE